MNRLNHLTIISSLLFTGLVSPLCIAAERKQINFYIETDCDCIEQLADAASYWMEKLNIRLLIVEDLEYAHIVFTKIKSYYGSKRVVVLNEKQISDFYWMTNTVGRELLDVTSVEEALARYGKNNLKPQQKTTRDPVREDAPQHIKDLLKSMDEARSKRQ